MNLEIGWAIPQVITFMLVVGRLSGLFLLAPVFSSSLIPMKVKASALLVLSATMTPIVSHGVVVPTDGWSIAILMAKETIIGLGLGFAVSVVFAAVQVGASMIDTSIGFSLANIIDPLTNAQASVLGSFYTLVGTLAFLAVDGHFWLLAGFSRSFDVIGVTQFPKFSNMLDNAAQMFFSLFVMAFQVAAPILVTLLLCDVVLGIVARVVPQMNVFFVGIPLKIAIGMGAIALGMPVFVSFFEHRVSDIVMGASVLANTAAPSQPPQGGG